MASTQEVLDSIPKNPTLPSDIFPPVVFDLTLYDLLKQELGEGEEVEAFNQSKPNSDYDHPDVQPFSEKYIIQSSGIDDDVDLAHISLENCSYLLMFIAGPMDVIFIAADDKISDPYLTQKYVDYTARYEFGAIQEKQRANVITYKNVEDFIKNHPKGKKVRFGFSMDCAEHVPALYHPDVTYLLNSKRWLANCPVKSANDQIIDTEIKCSNHVVNNLWYWGGKNCKECQEGIDKEVDRVKKIFSDKSAPYVVKMSQSLSAVGTIIVSKEEKKEDLLKQIDTYLRAYLPKISKENAYLFSTTLILSDFIEGETRPINFFVRKDGSCVFLGICTQLVTGAAGRQTSAIDYTEQEELEPKYRQVLADIGKALHDAGNYYGPGGGDLMHDPNDGTIYAIDLNVRMALSWTLYGLRTHLYKNRGYTLAMAVECVVLSISREELEKKFHKELMEARLIIMGNSRMGSKKEWSFGFIVAGENKKVVDDLMHRIEEYEKGKELDA